MSQRPLRRVQRSVATSYYWSLRRVQRSVATNYYWSPRYVLRLISCNGVTATPGPRPALVGLGVHHLLAEVLGHGDGQLQQQHELVPLRL